MIGGATYERLEPGSVVERLPPLHVKGKAEPLDAYSLDALGSRGHERPEEQPRDDDRNEEIDESPAPDPEKKGDAADDPEAD